MIRNKTHHRIVSEELEKQAKYYREKIKDLEERLKKAENLELILNKLYPLYTSNCIVFSNNGGCISGKFNLPDDVLVYVDDLFGGKVIKQEGNKAIRIEKDGTIKTGLTKDKVDEGYTYKLIRD